MRTLPIVLSLCSLAACDDDCHGCDGSGGDFVPVFHETERNDDPLTANHFGVLHPGDHFFIDGFVRDDAFFQAISHTGLGAYAASSDATPNAADPSSRRRRRPTSKRCSGAAVSELRADCKRTSSSCPAGIAPRAVVLTSVGPAGGVVVTGVARCVAPHPIALTAATSAAT